LTDAFDGTSTVTPGNFEFAGKEFRRTSKTLQECYTELEKCYPTATSKDFLKRVKATIKDLHELGFAFAPNIGDGGFRTFKEQHELKTENKKPPGESFHNYALAVDLGCWQWVDNNGEEHDGDYWLEKMEKAGDYGAAYANAIWNTRDKFAKAHGLVPVSSERIHLQLAGKTCEHTLAALLNKVGRSKYKYRGSAKTQYTCDFGKGGAYYSIGTATQMWAGNAAVSDADVKKAFDINADPLFPASDDYVGDVAANVLWIEIIDNIKKDMRLASENWTEAKL